MAIEYKIFSSPVTGEIEITENSQFNEIQAEKVTVAPNITVRLYGTVRDIKLNKESLVYLHGRIIGNVHNEGGEIHVFAR